jgi:hypothetical protein
LAKDGHQTQETEMKAILEYLQFVLVCIAISLLLMMDLTGTGW